jgi:hypothetical protein
MTLKETDEAETGLSRPNSLGIIIIIIIIIIILVLLLNEGKKVKLTVFCSPTPRRMESSYEGLGQSK